MKTLILLAFSISLYAAPMNPDFTVDGITLDPAAPGKGGLMYAIPGTTWDLFLEDWTDGDYDDYWTRVVFGLPSATGLPATATFMGSLAGYQNTIYIFGHATDRHTPLSLNLPVSLIGQVVPFVNSVTHIDLLIKDWVLYPMGNERLMVRCVDCPSEVPEPSMTVLVAAGLLGIALMLRSRELQ